MNPLICYEKGRASGGNWEYTTYIGCWDVLREPLIDRGNKLHMADLYQRAGLAVAGSVLSNKTKVQRNAMLTDSVGMGLVSITLLHNIMRDYERNGQKVNWKFNRIAGARKVRKHAVDFYFEIGSDNMATVNHRVASMISCERLWPNPYYPIEAEGYNRYYGPFDLELQEKRGETHQSGHKDS